jgi:hypothetical protein
MTPEIGGPVPHIIMPMYAALSMRELKKFVVCSVVHHNSDVVQLVSSPLQLITQATVYTNPLFYYPIKVPEQ